MNSTSTVLVVQHVPSETLGTIAPQLARRGLTPRVIRVFEGEEVPRRCDGACGLIVMGGPMSVNDHERLPHLKHEMALIESALEKPIPILGVCLGSQLLAQVLGSPIGPGDRLEVGWHPVTLAPAGQTHPFWSEAPETFQGFHWHGEVFDLPNGADRLASSAMTPCQAFSYGASAFGVLFHMEVDAPLIDAMAASFPDELERSQGTLEQLRQGASEHLVQLTRIGARFYSGWAQLAQDAAG